MSWKDVAKLFYVFFWICAVDHCYFRISWEFIDNYQGVASIFSLSQWFADKFFIVHLAALIVARGLDVYSLVMVGMLDSSVLLHLFSCTYLRTIVMTYLLMAFFFPGWHLWSESFTTVDSMSILLSIDSLLEVSDVPRSLCQVACMCGQLFQNFEFVQPAVHLANLSGWCFF